MHTLLDKIAFGQCCLSHDNICILKEEKSPRCDWPVSDIFCLLIGFYSLVGSFPSVGKIYCVYMH
jgi:hypothetical protein